MTQNKIYCDVCGAEITGATTSLTMLTPMQQKEWHIECMCESCREAIDNALDLRQHIMSVTVTPYKQGYMDVYQLDDRGRRVSKGQQR